MTDARIITREELLEFVQAERHRAFEDGYELGQKMACLEKPGYITNSVRLPHIKESRVFEEALDRLAKNSPRGE